MHALDALTTVLRNPFFSRDAILLEELLIFVKSSFASKAVLIRGAAVPKAARMTSHYLSNLEGCNSNILSLVQKSFIQFYNAITEVLEKLILEWSVNASADLTSNIATIPNNYASPVKLLINLWALNFSNRDQFFISRSKFLGILFEAISLEKYDSLVKEWTEVHSQIISRSKLLERKGLPGQKDFKSLCAQTTKEKLESGSLSYRSVNARLHADGILSTVDTVLSRNDIAHLMHVYERTINEVGEAEPLVMRSVTSAADVPNISKGAEELSSFDPAYCSPFITLQASNTRAFSIETPNGCAVVLSPFEFIMSKVAPRNYFEIQILAHGNGMIAVGFSARQGLQIDDKMPGLYGDGCISYGYHGNDGKTYGPNSIDLASPPWPTWSSGDIVGCGIDYASRSIFYTLNGVKLGNAFDKIAESACLYPIVGFALSSEDLPKLVSINFDVSTFAYDGPELPSSTAGINHR